MDTAPAWFAPAMQHALQSIEDRLNRIEDMVGRMQTDLKKVKFSYYYYTFCSSDLFFLTAHKLQG